MQRLVSTTTKVLKGVAKIQILFYPICILSKQKISNVLMALYTARME